MLDIKTLSLKIEFSDGSSMTLSGEALRVFEEHANPENTQTTNKKDVWRKIFSVVKNLRGYEESR